MRLAILADARDGRDLYALALALCALNLAWMRSHSAPPLYRAGVRYRRERRGTNGRRKEEWLTAPVLLQRGHGDCEDLACYRVAELQAAGDTQAKPRLTRHGRTWHVTVLRGDGRIEDPSKRLGMRGTA